MCPLAQYVSAGGFIYLMQSIRGQGYAQGREDVPTGGRGREEQELQGPDTIATDHTPLINIQLLIY